MKASKPSKASIPSNAGNASDASKGKGKKMVIFRNYSLTGDPPTPRMFAKSMRARAYTRASRCI